MLIHGWPLNADSWEYQARPLAEAGYRVVSYDRRGFGRSEQPWHGYDYDTLSDDLADIINALGLTDTVICGFSMGGGEVSRYMSRHGAKGVRKAALISSIAPFMLKTDDHKEGVAEDDLRGIAEELKKDRQTFLKGFFKGFYGVGMMKHPVSETVIDWTWNMAMMASPQATLACASAFGFTDLRVDMSAFNVPTLVVHGTGDETVPIDATGRLAAEMIGGNAELKEYDGAPHGLTATHADKLATDLLTFMRT